MKTKSRSSMGHYDQTWYVTDLYGNVLVDGGVLGYDYTSKYERIDYRNARNQYNPCVHDKFFVDLTPVMRRWRKTTTNPDKWDNSNAIYKDTYDTLEGAFGFASTLSGLDTFDWQNFYQRAIEAMTPTLESGFSLGNFVYELGEIKSLLRWWSRGKSYLRNLGDAYLNYSFGLRPFLMDLKNLATGLFTVRDRLIALKAGAGKLNVRRYSEEDGNLTSSVITPHTANDVKRDWTVNHVKYTATMTYTYQYPDIDSDLEGLYALLDAIGLNLNPQIIWDAIPYSFVVDWFFNVGDFLAQLRKKWVPVTITIKEFGVSVKMQYYYDRYVRSVGTVSTDWMWCGELWHRYYARRPVKVDDRCFMLSDTGSLTTRKFILGSLLLKQRIIR